VFADPLRFFGRKNLSGADEFSKMLKRLPIHTERSRLWKIFPHERENLESVAVEVSKIPYPHVPKPGDPSKPRGFESRSPDDDAPFDRGKRQVGNLVLENEDLFETKNTQILKILHPNRHIVDTLSKIPLIERRIEEPKSYESGFGFDSIAFFE
jgi:hypothetical protein